jgi:putative hydrolase of the HAD superfamily
MIKLIAFDADDTLWDCQSHFVEVEQRYCQLLADYADEQTVSHELFKTETANMAELGYGCKAFTLSLVENAVKISQGRIPANLLLQIQDLGRSLLRLAATPLPEVRETLEQLRHSLLSPSVPASCSLPPAPCPLMIVFTKGEIDDQQHKLERSGLAPLFDDCVVVADKTKDEYIRLAQRYGVDISEMLSVGNSFKSDVEPVLQLGGYAVHIPFTHLWAHEHTEEYEHPRLKVISHFGEFLQVFRMF